MIMDTKRIKTWWLLALAGLFLFGVGAFSIADAATAYDRLARYSGYVLLVNGLLLMVISAIPSTYPKEKKWLFAESILDLGFAVILLFSPVLTAIIYPFMIGFWMFGLGTLKILAALSLARKIKGWVFILLTGVLAILFSLLLVTLPMEKLDRSMPLFGIFCLASGALSMYDAFRFRKMEETLNLFF